MYSIDRSLRYSPFAGGWAFHTRASCDLSRAPFCSLPVRVASGWQMVPDFSLKPTAANRYGARSEKLGRQAGRVERSGSHRVVASPEMGIAALNPSCLAYRLRRKCSLAPFLRHPWGTCMRIVTVSSGSRHRASDRVFLHAWWRACANPFPLHVADFLH